jgi:hypothetical protein
MIHALIRARGLDLLYGGRILHDAQHVMIATRIGTDDTRILAFQREIPALRTAADVFVHILQRRYEITTQSLRVQRQAKRHALGGTTPHAGQTRQPGYQSL